MISEKIYDGDGITKVYPVDFKILGENFVAVAVDAEFIVDRTRYDIINNSISFSEAYIPQAGTGNVVIYVATSAAEIAELPGALPDITIVAANITNINLVAVNVAPFVTEILEAGENFPQVAADAAQVAADRIVVAADRVAVEIIGTELAGLDKATIEASTWNSEASNRTSTSYATEPEDVFVNVHTSDGDGTYTATPTTDYSSLHWAAKSAETGGGGGGIGEFKDTSLAIASDDTALGGTFGDDNFAIGRNSILAPTSTGVRYNIALGKDTLMDITIGEGNVAVGHASGQDVTSGDFNTFVGYNAGWNNHVGSFGTFIGYKAGYYNRNGESNIGIGKEACIGQPGGLTGNNNIGIGFQTGFTNWLGSDNVMVGLKSGYGLYFGKNNVLVGKYSGTFLRDGDYNTFIGDEAGRYFTESDGGIALGDGAMRGATSASGNDNIGIGRDCGSAITTGFSNTMVGLLTGITLTTGSNNTMLGNGAEVTAAGVTNEITLGNSSVSSLRCQVTTITSLSDRRDKTNIKDLDAGLDFIMNVRPRSFDWNMRDGGKVGMYDIGFIAQELHDAQIKSGNYIPHLVNYSNPDKLEAGYGMLVAPLVKSVHELKNMIDELRAEIDMLKGAK